MSSKDWQQGFIEDVCDVKGRIGWRGYTVEDLREEGPLVIGATQISSDQRIDLRKPVYLSREKYLESPDIFIEKHDIIIVKVGNTIGKVAIVNVDLGEACINPNTVLLKRIRCNPHFLYYTLIGREAQHYLKSNSAASAQPALNQATLKRMPIYLPPESVQDKIAAILSSLDDKIELNRQTNKTLEAIAQALFKEWFVDSNFPGATGEMVNSELGEIPKGWRVGKLGDVLSVKGGTTPSTTVREYWDGTFHWATPRDLSKLEFPVLLETERKLTEKGIKQISSGILPINTLLLSSRAPIGYLAITDIPVSINQGFIAINGTELSNIYLLFWLKQNMDKVVARANGSTFLEISKTAFKEINIIIPSKEAVEDFDKVAWAVFNQLKNNDEQTKTLIQVRDALLPKLMTGRIKL